MITPCDLRPGVEYPYSYRYLWHELLPRREVTESGNGRHRTLPVVGGGAENRYADGLGNRKDSSESLGSQPLSVTSKEKGEWAK